MGIHIGIEHRTTYRFDRAVQIHPHVIRLRPAPHCRTPILAYSLRVTPSEHFINWQQDPFGNFMARLVFPEPAKLLDVTVDLIADLTVINPFDFFVEESAKAFPFVYEPQLAARPRAVPAARRADRAAADASGCPAATCRRAATADRRLPRRTQSAALPRHRVLGPHGTRRADPRRDARSRHRVVPRHRVAARGGAAPPRARRTVRVRLPRAADLRPSRHSSGADGPEADFTDLHAWAEVYVPGAGWIGLDPTSGLFAGEGHIPLACTPHPSTAAPISGTHRPAEVTFEFSERRCTGSGRTRGSRLPYTPEQWARIDELGEEVDKRLDAGDVRLTMGGEPTFVSIDDMEGAEWNTAADGEAKRALAARPRRPRSATGSPTGGLIQHGQGKWYPGEPLPRWQTRHRVADDGEPLWRRRRPARRPGETRTRRPSRMRRALADGIAAAIRPRRRIGSSPRSRIRSTRRGARHASRPASRRRST